MNIQTEYEQISQQLINKKNSYFMVPDRTPQDTIHIMHDITGFSKKDSPIIY